MNGLIAFFDILGYKSFLKNNKALESAQLVLDLITSIPNTISSKIERISNDNKAGVAEELHYLVFSDTIVVLIKFPDASTQNWRTTALAYLEVFSAVLFNEMLTNGLPLRGAITEGEFIYKDTCLAGEAVVEAYELCESLGVSGIVYSPKVVSRALSNPKKKYCINYLTSLKGGREEHFLHINWMYLMSAISKQAYELAIPDIAMFISRAFWGHNKDCSLSVDEKLNNTIKLARRLIIETQSIATKNKPPGKTVGPNPLDALPAPKPAPDFRSASTLPSGSTHPK